MGTNCNILEVANYEIIYFNLNFGHNNLDYKIYIQIIMEKTPTHKYKLDILLYIQKVYEKQYNMTVCSPMPSKNMTLGWSDPSSIFSNLGLTI